MADWFKFFENGIYESRFQWAIHQESGVCPVWLWILSECCKHKSDNFGWKGQDYELFGASHVVNLTAPKVNEAINLLVKIGYIQCDGAHIKVLQWNKFQSDYMRKLSKETPDTIRTLSGHTPESVGLEEKRGEENKKEEPLRSIAISILDHLNQKGGKAFRPVNGTLEPIMARLKEGATEEDCKRVVDIKISDWLGKPEWEKYLRPETLFRASKFHGYLGGSVSTKPARKDIY